MTEEQKRQFDTFDKVSYVTGYLLALLDDIKGMPQYKFSLSKTGNQFKKQLEKMEAMNVMLRDELKESQTELHNSYSGIENIVNCMMNLKNDNQREYLNKELEVIFNKYNLIEE